MRTPHQSTHGQVWRRPRLRRRRDGTCTELEHRLGVQAYHEAQRSRALDLVRVGAFDEEICEAAKITKACLDCWFVADAAFWKARRAFRDECLATLRAAAENHDDEARQWLLDRGVPLEGP